MKLLLKKIIFKLKAFLKKVLPDWLFEKVYHAIFWPILGMLVYRFPSRKIKVIGVTGTNGKTTVVHIATHILENAGYKVASISSLRFKIGDKEWKNTLKMTIPGRLKQHKFLRQAVDAKCDFVILEVTSEGIKQNRHRFIKFDSVVFTNLTREHIESHGSFDKYREAKGKLFLMPHRLSVVNLDDKSADYFLNFPAEEKIGYSIGKEITKTNESEYKKIFTQSHEVNQDGIKLTINQVDFNIKLWGEFNIYNSLASVAVCVGQGISLNKIQETLLDFRGVPGRLELVIKEPFRVLVDYAHTPDALEKVYQTITDKKIFIGEGRMICVFGATGGTRDKWKRPEFGKIASKYCQEIILTDEDPYDENPENILKDIEKGFSNDIKYEKIINRREAIRKALKIAKEKDVVIITGKGAEPLMVTSSGSIGWDDRDVVKEEFKKLFLEKKYEK